MNSSTATTPADPELDQLMRRHAAKQAEALETKAQTNTPTSVEKLLQHDERKCNRSGCDNEWRAIKTPMGKWVPDRCPACYPSPELSVVAAEGKGTSWDGDILLALHEAGVNVHRFKDATFDNFDASQEDESLLTSVFAWLEAYRTTASERYPTRDWIYMFGHGSRLENGARFPTIGKTGNGKTKLAIAIGRYLIEQGLLPPQRFAFRTAETLLLQCEATFRAQSENSEMMLLSHYGNFDLLIIDEFGLRPELSPHAARVFDELLKRREGKATIFTSNVSIRVIRQSSESSKRIVSRFSGECGDGGRYFLRFTGEDRRKARSLPPDAEAA